MCNFNFCILILRTKNTLIQISFHGKQHLIFLPLSVKKDIDCVVNGSQTVNSSMQNTNKTDTTPDKTESTDKDKVEPLLTPKPNPDEEIYDRLRSKKEWDES